VSERYYPFNGRYDPIAQQTEGNYQDYLKIKGFEDVGYFLQSYVVSGGTAAVNPTYNNTVDVSKIVVVLNNDVMARVGASFVSTVPSTIYYLDITKDGDWSWGLAHPLGVVGVDYLTVASVSTNVIGNISTVTDLRGVVGGFRLKDDYGLEAYAKKTYVDAADANMAKTNRDNQFTATQHINGSVVSGWGVMPDGPGSTQVFIVGKGQDPTNNHEVATQIGHIRNGASSGTWEKVNVRIARTVDGTDQQYIDFDGAGNITLALYGGQLQTNIAGSVFKIWHDWNNPLNTALNGYQKFSSGLIIQWGFATIPNSVLTSIGFPAVFPNACIVAIPIIDDTSPFAVSTSGRAASFFNVVQTSGASRTVLYIALGY